MVCRSPSELDVVIATRLRKAYGQIVAVNDLDLRVRRGEICGLIGPNGAGKTTLIKMLVGILEPDEGELSILGRSAFDPLAKAGTGYMPQEAAIYPDLSVLENLDFFADIHGISGEFRQERIGGVLELVDLDERANTVAGSLSGGMQHRLSLACALVHDPALLFLDEPTVGVDPELRVAFWSYFAELARGGKTIVISTHYMEEASRCMRVGMIHRGRMIAEGDPGRLTSEAGVDSLEDAFLRRTRDAGGVDG
jgi:ABC-2 type transport system ATP-binding protein